MGERVFSFRSLCFIRPHSTSFPFRTTKLRFLNHRKMRRAVFVALICLSQRQQ